MLLLSGDAEKERRERIIEEVRQAISSGGGSISHDDDWGTRPLAYRIAHQSDAEYHLLQFTGPPALLDSLGHSLGIADGVLRFRIIKVLPGTPGPPRPEPAPPAAPPRPDPAPVSSPTPAPPAEAASVPTGGPEVELESDAQPGTEAEAGPEGDAGE
jgi:small subunit ribosomal protein S6